MAENFAVVIYVLGFCSLLGIYFDYKNHVKAKLVAAITLIIAVVSVVFATLVGNSEEKFAIRKSGQMPRQYPLQIKSRKELNFIIKKTRIKV